MNDEPFYTPGRVSIRKSMTREKLCVAIQLTIESVRRLIVEFRGVGFLLRVGGGATRRD